MNIDPQYLDGKPGVLLIEQLHCGGRSLQCLQGNLSRPADWHLHRLVHSLELEQENCSLTNSLAILQLQGEVTIQCNCCHMPHHPLHHITTNNT